MCVCVILLRCIRSVVYLPERYYAVTSGARYVPRVLSKSANIKKHSFVNLTILRAIDKQM